MTQQESPFSQSPGQDYFPELRDNTASELTFEPGPNHETRLAELRAAIEQRRNPYLEAGRVLLRSLAEIPNELSPEGVRGLHALLTQELKTFTHLCEQAALRRDHMLAVRYALCTALDEAVNKKAWAGGEGESTGMWSTQALLNQFHGESQGGKTVFLLIGRLANSPAEHMPVLEVMHHLLSLGFMGHYSVEPDGHRTVETIRHRLYTMVAASRDPVARELSPHWQGVGAGKFKMLRSIPVWVSASVLGLVLFAQYAWFKYDLLTDASEVQKNIQALAKIKPPATLKPQGVNLTQLLQAEIAQGSVQVDENAQGARVIFKGDGMFTPALDKLSQPTALLLNKVGEALAQVGGQVRVIGHTDDLPVSGTDFANNQELSEKRAHSVAQVLMAKGVVTTRLQVMGMGDKQPVASNTSPQGRALNRRVEIEVLPQDGAAPAKTPSAPEAPSTVNTPAPAPARSK